MEKLEFPEVIGRCSHHTPGNLPAQGKHWPTKRPEANIHDVNTR